MIGAFFIGYGMFYLLAVLGIIPGLDISGPTLPAILAVMQMGMVVVGVYYIWAVRKKAEQGTLPTLP